MSLTPQEESLVRTKQLALGLSDPECSAVLDNISQFFQFSDAQTELHSFILDFLDSRLHPDSPEVA